MNVIRQLSPHVADLIAAGEVVERPASVVKELLENSFDAGATKITVEIQRGGMSLIRVTDNGCGMSPEDAGTAFLRHATSKLRDEYGLEAIGTLGFRGEALAAISAVSRIQLLTRLKGSEEGVNLQLEAGTEASRDPAGCPEGTTIIVRDLFYNTPARLKFMRKDSAETASVSSAVTRCALSHPDVSVRYLKDGKEEFQTSGNGRLDDCIYTVLGREFAKTMLPAAGSGENITVEGYICPPAGARGNRNGQFFFLNGRWVKSQLLQAALEQAYRNALFTGRYPACVLFLTLKLNQVDVNVHPAKTEVRFLQERAVFDAVYRAVLGALNGESEKPELLLPSEKSEPAKPIAPAPKQEKRGELRPAFAETEKPAAPPKAAQPAVPPKPEKKPEPLHYEKARQPEELPANMPEIVEQLVFSQTKTVYNVPEKRPTEQLPVHRVSLLEEKPEAPQTPENVPAPAPEAEPPQPVPEAETAPIPAHRIIGECFNEYILVEVGEELLLIDKHAAHERMLFDRLKSRDYPAMSQLLMTPQVCELDAEDKALLLENAELLEELGIEADDFGGGSMVVRQLPADFAPGEAAGLLSELAASLRLGRKPGTLGVRDETLATMACKAAIKAGKGSDPKEWKPVVEAVLSGSVKYCPHGRPVSMSLTRKQIDRNFKRI